MSKKKIEAHGGNILFNTNELKGSTFAFSLQLTRSRGTEGY
ncbi:MAG: hypothetical protein ACR2KF_01615 [Nitrososphaeraceae archaeon]